MSPEAVQEATLEAVPDHLRDRPSRRSGARAMYASQRKALLRSQFRDRRRMRSLSVGSVRSKDEIRTQRYGMRLSSLEELSLLLGLLADRPLLDRENSRRHEIRYGDEWPGRDLTEQRVLFQFELNEEGQDVQDLK